MTIRDRIIDFRRVKASELVPNPANWREHPKAQVGALRGVLGEIGFADAVLAREVNGHLELIDGHCRRELTLDMDVPVLVTDLDEAEAAKWAVMHWHYSRTMPAGKTVKIGVWEKGQFIGVILFGMGGGRSTCGTKYGLAKQFEIAELVRIAMSQHEAPVSRIVSIALRLLKRQSPGLRMVISFADTRQGHLGIIYQAGGWVYTGTPPQAHEYFAGGKWRHNRSAQIFGSKAGKPHRSVPPKHRYLMPLDPAMRAQIEPLRKPYPKCVRSVDSDTLAVQAGEGDTISTRTLCEVAK